MSVTLAIYVPEGDQAGMIIRIVKCSQSVASFQARDGEAMLEIPRDIIFNDTTHYIDLSGEEPFLAERTSV